MVFKRAPVCSAMHFGTRGGVIGVGHKAVYLTDSTEAKLVFKYTVSLYKMVIISAWIFDISGAGGSIKRDILTTVSSSKV